MDLRGSEFLHRYTIRVAEPHFGAGGHGSTATLVGAITSELCGVLALLQVDEERP